MEEDEFGALYGVEASERPEGALYSSPPQQQPAQTVAGDEGEDDLYHQLYGEAAPAEELPGFGGPAAAAQPEGAGGICS